MKYLKKEWIGKISSIIKIGKRGGINEYCVTFVDGTEEDVLEYELNKYYR